MESDLPVAEVGVYTGQSSLVRIHPKLPLIAL